MAPSGRRISLASLTVAALLCARAAGAQAPSNPGFEDPGVTDPGQAAGWSIMTQGYRIWRDTTVAHSGRASLAIQGQPGGRFAAGSQVVAAAPLRGHTLHLSVWVRTQDVSGWAGFWVRVDGEGTRMLRLDNMETHGASGTRDWTLYETTMPVDTAAALVLVGPILAGSGTAWYDDLVLQVDGAPLGAAAAWAPAPGEVAWARRNLIPLRTERAGSGFDDLKRVGDIVGDARIVSLGEGTHGTAEYFRMKHRLTEYLATKHGFTVFAIEASMPEARTVNEYVLTGRGDPRAALAGLHFWTWNTEEVLDMIQWMRAYNAAGTGRIEFWGFDMQFPMIALDSVRAFVARRDGGYLPAFDSSYRVIGNAWARARNGGQDANLLSAWRAASGAVLAHLEEYRPQPGADTMELAWAIQNARVAAQAVEALRPGGASRDASMAANVGWILRHQPPGTRIVLWAHNGHVQRQPGFMGGHLSSVFGDRMRVFGFAMGTGRYTAVGPRGLTDYPALPAPAGSFEQVFHALGPRFVLDLRPAASAPDGRWLSEPHPFRMIGALATDAQFQPTSLSKAYDAIIYFDSTTPARQVGRAAAAPGPPDRLPPGWKQGSPQQPEYYRVDQDTIIRHGGRSSVHLSARQPMANAVGAVVQKLSAQAYAGKRVRFSAWLRTSGGGVGAALNIRAAGGDRALDEADAPFGGPGGEWSLQSVVLDVPAGTDELFVRCWLSGGGELWMDDTSLEVVGPDVMPMNTHKPMPYNASPAVKAWWGPLPDHLVNPGLEPELPAAPAN